MRYFKNTILLFFLLFFNTILYAQYIVKGKIIDESNHGIPFAVVFVKNHPEFRTRSDVNGNYLLRLEVGEYYMVFTADGYEKREHYLAVKGKNIDFTIQLFPIQFNNLETVSISTKNRNIAREIVKHTIKIKDLINYNRFPYNCQVYIKATNKDIHEAKEGKQEKQEKVNYGDARYDDLEELKLKKMQAFHGLNMVEVRLQRDYSPPDHIKEKRNAYSKIGSDKYLYYTTTAKSHFDFFQNTLYLNDLSKNPIQSPISTAGIFSYKYELIQKIERDTLPDLFKIKITPRKIATSTLEGYLWIEDSTWLIEKLSFQIAKENLYLFDHFSIQQDFQIVGDTMCVLKNQQMEYGVSFKREKFNGQTEVVFTDYNFNPKFSKKYFSNEVAVTTENAYNRKENYWNKQRMTPLTTEEQAFIKHRDSINNLFTKKSFLDSVDSVFNKITFWKVLWFGIDHRNREKKIQWTLSSIAAMIRPIYIAGPRVGPDFDFYKKWDNEHALESYSRVDIGVMNADVKGNTDLSYLYNAFKQSTIGISFTHDYDLIRSYDALTHILLRDNFIQKTGGKIYHNFEVVNGLYLESDLSFAHRASLPKDTRFIHWFDKVLENSDPPVFKAYNALLLGLSLRFTPFQKYMREPKRKVILGSKWPTFSVFYEFGIPKIFGSDVDHHYIHFAMEQTFKIGTLGTSTYRLSTGKYIAAKILHPADYRYHRRSDPLLFSNPLYSYQALDSTLPSKNWYFESHYIHHFNGAIINKIPFMKRTRITTVVGGGYLWVPDHDNWQYYEIFAGLERIFKFSRRRLRLGAYVVFSDGNHTNNKFSFKISFAILNERDMKFTF